VNAEGGDLSIADDIDDVSNTLEGIPETALAKQRVMELV
jgi:hypothetical protein